MTIPIFAAYGAASDSCQLDSFVVAVECVLDHNIVRFGSSLFAFPTVAQKVRSGDHNRFRLCPAVCFADQGFAVILLYLIVESFQMQSVEIAIS